MSRILFFLSFLLLNSASLGQTLNYSDVPLQSQKPIIYNPLDSNSCISGLTKYPATKKTLRIHSLDTNGNVQTSEPLGEINALFWLDIFKWDRKYYRLLTKGSTKKSTVWIQEVEETDLSVNKGEKIIILENEAGFNNISLLSAQLLANESGKLLMIGEEKGKSKDPRILKYVLYDLNTFSVERQETIRVPESVQYSLRGQQFLANDIPLITLYSKKYDQVVLEYVWDVNSKELIDVHPTRDSKKFKTLQNNVNERGIVSQFNLNLETMGFHLTTFQADNNSFPIDDKTFSLEELLINDSTKQSAKYLAGNFRGNTVSYKIEKAIGYTSKDGSNTSYMQFRFSDEKAGTIYVDFLYRINKKGEFEWINTTLPVTPRIMMENHQGETYLFFNSDSCNYNEAGMYDLNVPYEKDCRKNKGIAQIKISSEGKIIERRLTDTGPEKVLITSSMYGAGTGKKFIIVSVKEGGETKTTTRIGTIDVNKD